MLIDEHGTPQVVDFGLARSAFDLHDEPAVERSTDDVLATPMTRTGAVLGTPAYMSAEQHNGERVDARSDQFSFAVSLYEGLYGERPFAGRTLPEIAAAVVAGEIREPTNSLVPTRLRTAVVRGLRADPSKRYESVAAMLEAISRASRPPRWKTVAVILGALALAATIAAGVVVFAGHNDDDRESLGALSLAQVQQVVRSNAADVQQCYEEGSGDDPSAAGTIRIRFTIDPGGAVKRTEVVSDDMPKTNVARCIASRSMFWDFPPPEGGGVVTVDYAFELGSKSE